MRFLAPFEILTGLHCQGWTVLHQSRQRVFVSIRCTKFATSVLRQSPDHDLGLPMLSRAPSHLRVPAVQPFHIAVLFSLSFFPFVHTL